MALTLAVSHTHVKVVECVALEAERRWTDVAYHASGYAAVAAGAQATLYLLTGNGYIDRYERRSGVCTGVIDVAAGTRRQQAGTLRWADIAASQDEAYLTLSSRGSKGGNKRRTVDVAIVNVGLYFEQHPTHKRQTLPSLPRPRLSSADNGSDSGSDTAANSRADDDEDDDSSEASSDDARATPMAAPLVTPPNNSSTASGLLQRDRRLFAFDLTGGADETWLAEQRQLAEELRKRDPTSLQQGSAGTFSR